MIEDKFDTWGILELFGHQRIAGRISEQTIGGSSFIRVDVPQVDDMPAYTRFFTQGAIYSMTPLSEEMAVGLANYLRARPVERYEVRQLPVTSDDVSEASNGDDLGF